MGMLEKIIEIPEEYGDTKRQNALDKILKEAQAQNYYQIMGVSMEGPLDIKTVQKNYKKLALKLHPDKNNNKCYAKTTEDLFKLVNEAAAILTDSEKEKEYRNKLNHPTSNTDCFSGDSTSFTSPNSDPFQAMFRGFYPNDFSHFFYTDDNIFPNPFFGGSFFPGFSSSFSNTTNTNPSTSASSQKVVIIDSFAKFMDFLDKNPSRAIAVFNQDPDSVIAFFETHQQYMELVDKNMFLAHDFFRERPGKIIGFFQTFEQYMMLLNADGSLAHDFFRQQPDKIIGLIQSIDQFERIKEERLFLAGDILRKKPDLLSTVSSQTNQPFNQKPSPYHSPTATSRTRFFNQSPPNIKPPASSPSYLNILSGIALISAGTLTVALSAMLPSSVMFTTGLVIAIVGVHCLTSGWNTAKPGNSFAHNVSC